jgi:N-acetylglucosamine-6-sulfatase
MHNLLDHSKASPLANTSLSGVGIPAPGFSKPFLETCLGRLWSRLDALMMVMKSCKGQTCIEPWKGLHPNGDVRSLDDALDEKFDDFYREQRKVSFERCEAGYIVEAEGPQVGYEYREGLGWADWA